MSTINNVPFDINRTPNETNKVTPKQSADPVYSTEAIHKAPAHDAVAERRKRKDRRKSPMRVMHDRRMLKKRRQDAATKSTNNVSAKKPKGPGQIIDYQV